jgi:predicted 2-oxoglutarate/Fe(II)-dependent dioxygenase YbiX
MIKLGPMVIRSLKRAHDVPRDSCYFCLKDRTSNRRRTTLEMGKKAKQNLEHRISQSPCILPMVYLYHRLALPVKENGNNFHLKVL